jgi:hypothetical protein
MRSKTLSDYIKMMEMRDVPHILCGIHREEKEIQEDRRFDLESSDHFPLMTPSVKDLPSAQGYQYRSHGLWVAPNLDHIMYRSSGETKNFPIHEFNKVNEYAIDRGNKFMDEVKTATKSLAPDYSMYDMSHKKIIHRYRGDSMGNINHKLTTNSYLNPDDRKNIVSLDEALHVHSTPHDFVVFSGIDPEHAKNIISNDRVQHPAYLSTSLAPHVAASFAKFKPDEKSNGIEGHILKIHVPKGHPGAFVGHMDATLGEHELILPRGTILNIHRDKTLYAPIPHSDGKSLFTIHHATIETKK